MSITENFEKQWAPMVRGTHVRRAVMELLARARALEKSNADHVAELDGLPEAPKSPQDEVKDKVRAVLRLMKPGYMCAVWSEYSGWVAYRMPPAFHEPLSCWSPGTLTGYLLDFDLPPFPGDSRDSLVEREE